MTDRELEQLHILSTSAHALIPLVEERKEEAYNNLIREFRHNREVNAALIGACSAYSALIEDIQSKLNTYEHYIKEKHQ